MSRAGQEGQQLDNAQSGAEHHAVLDGPEASAPVRLHHLRIEGFQEQSPDFLQLAAYPSKCSRS